MFFSFPQEVIPSKLSVLIHKRFCKSSSYEAAHVKVSFFFSKHFPVIPLTLSDEAK